MQQRVLCGAVPTYAWNGKDEIKKVELIPSNRAKEVCDWWEENNRKPIVVWGRFHTDLDLLEAEFKKRGARVVLYDGRVKKKQKERPEQEVVHGREGGRLPRNADERWNGPRWVTEGVSTRRLLLEQPSLTSSYPIRSANASEGDERFLPLCGLRCSAYHR